MASVEGVPHLKEDLVLEGDGQEGHPEVIRVCKALLRGWAEVDESAVEVSVLRGGISNALFKVTPPEPLAPVVFRLYGTGSDRFINRPGELKVMKLVRKHGFGPELLATFGTGRIEGWLEGLTALDPERMSQPPFQVAIARTLARFHQIPIPPPPPADSSEVEATAATPAPDVAAGTGAGPRTPFARAIEWLESTSALPFRDPTKRAAFERDFDVSRLLEVTREIEALAARFDSPLVWSHNDVLCGNVMVPKAWVAGDVAEGDARPAGAVEPEGSTAPTAFDPSALTLIDFEYADPAPRGFDLGNHFCEYAGFDSEYHRYPDAESAKRFVRAYLEESATLAAAGGSQGAGSIIGESEVARVVAEANLFALAAHAYWGAWCFLQAASSALDFDYLEYAQVRWTELFARREGFLAAAREALGDGR